jgi:hypothetical protein
MIPGDRVSIVRVENTARGLTGYDNNGLAFRFVDVRHIENEYDYLENNILKNGPMTCIYLDGQKPNRLIIKDINNIDLLIDFFFEKGQIKDTQKAIYKKRLKQVACEYEKITKVLPLKKRSNSLIGFDNGSCSWVLPGFENMLFRTLSSSAYFLRVFPPPYLNWNSVYRCISFLPVCFKADVELFISGAQERKKKTCTIYLHSFLDGRSLHIHLIKHVLKNRQFHRYQKLFKSIPDNALDILHQHGCSIVQANQLICRNDHCEDEFEAVHGQVFRPILKEYFNIAVTFFQENTTKEIRGILPSTYFNLLCHNQEKVVDKPYRLLVFHGTCYDWNATHIMLHLSLASMYNLKDSYKKKLPQIGRIINVTAN